MNRRKIRIALLSPVVFLLIAEGALRLSGYRAPRYDWHERASYDYFIPYSENGKVPGYQRAQPRNYQEDLPLFTKEKPKNGFRIFVLGESSVQGLPYTTGCFCDWLRVRLKRMMPDRAVEVVNAGNRGWTVSAIAPLLDECLSYQPDLIVWMVGHNEFFSKNLLALRFEVEHPQLLRIREFLLNFRIGAALRRFMRPARRSDSGLTDVSVRDDRPVWGAELETIRARFAEITKTALQHCKQAGVPALACTLVRNAREMPPFGSYFKDSTRADPIRYKEWNRAYLGGLMRAESKDPAGAIQMFEEAARIDDTPAKLQFAMAKYYESAGDGDEARRRYLLALERDGFPIRAQQWVQDTIREGAASAGAPLVDLCNLFDANAQGLGLSGFEWIEDNVHPNLKGHEIIADAILDAMRENLNIQFDRARDLNREDGRRELFTRAAMVRQALRDEALADVRLVLQSGEANELWRRTREKLQMVSGTMRSDYEILANIALLNCIGGETERARASFMNACEADTDVRVIFLYYYKTQLPYQRVLRRLGVDMAAIEASLDAGAKARLAARLAEDR
ncbi:MAG: SGNH/GDSL hydrolase family protein [Planctomycetes bacterium]|nr:SGNH/GDSL hydrolase family protein [Planctomycetota bacterium]